jgi:DinB superfamily
MPGMDSPAFFFTFIVKMVPRSAIVASDFNNAYIQLTKEEEIGKALEKNTQQFRKLLKKIPKKKIDYAYAEGKWTIREMLQHIIDAERVFAYRALRAARRDSTPLPGFDENSWAAHAGVANRKWEDLVEEFKVLRRSTELLFATFSDEQLTFVGEASGSQFNALAMGFLIPGHVAHHMRILKEKYL